MSRNDDFYENGHSCLIPFLLLLVALFVGGYFFLKHIGFDFQKLLPERFRRAKTVEVTPVKEVPKPVEKPKVVEAPKPVEVKPAEKPKPKTMAELKAETDAAQKVLDGEIEAARKENAGRALKSFAKIRFGSPMEGLPIRTEYLNDHDMALVMYGPAQESPFLKKFDNPPIVRVTPKTRRIFQIEFSRKIERKAGWKIDPETTNLVAMLAAKLKCRPYSLDYSKYPLGSHTYVFPLGETTFTVGEYGGERLKMTVEDSVQRKLASAESGAIRAGEGEDAAAERALVSGKYPNSGMVKFGRLRVKSATPRSFCGIVFGSLPPYSAKVAAPTSITPSRHFYIDYRKTKCEPFGTFDHGQVELSAINGAAIAVNLYSDGSDEGLGDAEFFRKTRSAIERRFKVGSDTYRLDQKIEDVTYDVGDVKISLGPDPRGGFYLKAVNTAMKEAW